MLLGCMAFIISCGSVVSQKNKLGPNTVERLDAVIRFSCHVAIGINAHIVCVCVCVCVRVCVCARICGVRYLLTLGDLGAEVEDCVEGDLVDLRKRFRRSLEHTHLLVLGSGLEVQRQVLCQG
jgi:hypothetical protein